MRIGLCYDLREEYLALGYSPEQTAEFDRPDTIEAIERALQAAGHITDRIGSIYSLIPRLQAKETWDLVFNIAEGMYGFGRESLVPALLDAYCIPYTFSDPAVLAVSLHKALAKHVVRDLGISTPDFALVHSVKEAAAVGLSYPLFLKPVAEGTGKGIGAQSRVSSTEELLEVCAALLEQHRQPVLVETFLPGRELTVGIVGTGAKARAIGTLEAIPRPGAEANAYSYINKENCEQLIDYRLCEDEPLASESEKLALAAWTGLGCRDAGRVDIRADEAEKPFFLEVNPLAGLNPVHSDLPILCTLAEINFQQLIEDILASALERVVRR